VTRQRSVKANFLDPELMRRVWAIDVLECPRCKGRMKKRFDENIAQGKR
jgi:hypothetical protein